MLDVACPDPAKVEPQYRKSEAMQGFSGLVDDFVVHGAAEKRMRVADNGGEWRRSGVVGSPEDGFEPADWAGEEKISGVVMLGH